MLQAERQWYEDHAYLVSDCCVFRQDGNTTLTLDVIAVHDTFLCLLICSKDLALLEHRVHLQSHQMSTNTSTQQQKTAVAVELTKVVLPWST